LLDVVVCLFIVFFFFSSRRRHTRCYRDWSSDVCSSDLLAFSATGLTGTTSSNVVVNPAQFAQLQLLLPGETAAPGTGSGKTGAEIGRASCRERVWREWGGGGWKERST